MTVETKVLAVDTSRPSSMADTPVEHPRTHPRSPISSPAFPLRSAFELPSHYSAGHSLEDLVRELLNPLLKQWLDHHLPQIVERRVNVEIERIANLSRSATS